MPTSIFVVPAHAASTPTVWTDQADYAPESTVSLYGTGFTPYAPIVITITDPDGVPTYLNPTADESGAFSASYVIDSLEGIYYVSATDGTTTADTTFTDSSPTTNVVWTTSGLPSSCTPSVSITITYSGTNPGNNPQSGSVTFYPGPSSGVGFHGSSSVTYSGFPASITCSGATYVLDTGHTTNPDPGSPFTTSASSSPPPTDTVIAYYALQGSADNTPPSMTKHIGTPQYSDGTNTFVKSTTPIWVTVTDASGVASCTLSGDTQDNGAYTSDTNFYLTTPDGSKTFSLTCYDTIGNHATLTETDIVDDTAPVITITSPVGTYVLNQPGVTASYSCGDSSGSGVATCTSTTFSNGGSVDTSTLALGSHTWTVTTTDNLGNGGSKDATYLVQYSFSCGRSILQPLQQVDDPDQLTKAYKLGSVLPVKFQLCDYNGYYVGSAYATISVAKVSSVTDAGDTTEAVDAGQSADNGVVFRYDTTAQQYIFNLQTKNLQTGYYRLTVTLNDLSTIVTYFELKR